MRAVALVALVVALTAPVADAKPRVKCLVRKSCGRPSRVLAVAPPMVPANPFLTPVVVTPPPKR